MPGYLGALVALSAFSACSYPPLPNLSGLPGDGPGGSHCRSDGDCNNMLDFPACELTIDQGTCVQCTVGNPSACTGTTPRCEHNACVACVDDAKDCNGGVCLGTGDCAATSRIIHTASTSARTATCGDGTQPACSLNGALGLVTSDKNVIKLDDVGPFIASGFTSSIDVTIDARGATLSRSDNGPIITVMGGKTLVLLGGIIHGTAGKAGAGIACSGPVSRYPRWWHWIPGSKTTTSLASTPTHAR